MRVVVVSVLLALFSLSAAAQTCPTPTTSAPPAAPATIPFRVSWVVSEGVATFELEESADASFTNATRSTVTESFTKLIAARQGIATDSRFYYRVRSVCGSATSAFSNPISTIVTAPLSATSLRYDYILPVDPGAQAFRQDLLVPGFGDTANNADTFTITIAGAPWATVFPTNGALSAGGTTVQITIEPADLGFGTASTTVTIARSNAGVAAGNISIPLTVTAGNPVTPVGRPRLSPPGTLFVPAVAHAAGFNSQFRSDVRILNTSNTAQTYDVTYTPAGNDGTIVGKRTSVFILPDSTVAFDDVVLTAFGSGVLGEPGAGTLEIRPPSAASPGTLFASSRTFNVNTVGTFGQFVPALDLDDFTSPGSNISLQQIVFNPRYRTNLGFVEGRGEAAAFRVKLFDKEGALLRTATQSLPPYGFRQLSLADPTLFPDVVIDDARVEIEVTSTTGLVTAYASILDNDTNDPFLVIPVLPETLEPRPRYVVPGIAELTSANNFHSDMRIYNPASSPQTVSLSYRPQTGDSTPVPTPVQRTIAAGAIDVIDDVLPTLWGLSGTGGAVTVVSNAPLVVTARTYSRNVAGTTYGLFIPAVTAADDSTNAAGNDLNVLQLEQSANFRSNLGLAETTGAAEVDLFITGTADSGETATKAITLQPGEFRQIGRVFNDLGFTKDVYNGRIEVRAVFGAGSVAAYGAVIDNRTDDPTYIPAQRP